MKRHVPACVLAVILILGTCSAIAEETGAPRFPGTEAGKRAAAYFAAFNSAAENDMRAYLEANLAPEALERRPIEQRIQMTRQIKDDAGTLEPVKIIDAREDALTVITGSAKGRWFEFTFDFEKAAPHKLIGVRLKMLDEPPDLNAPTTPLTEAEIIQESERYLDELVAEDEFSGVVLIASGETPVFRKAYGLASKEYNAPNRVDTRFNLGSITKFFTRIALEQLAGKGVLSLNDKIGKYLLEYPNKKAAEKVTISQLLEMTSGIGDFFGERFIATPKNRIRTLEDYLPLFADEPLHFEPGTSNEYSNGGFVVLGLIIEKVSGQSYFDYVQEHICAPAGLSGTGHLEADIPTENVASGYTRNWDGSDHPGEARRNNMYTRPARGSSAGGGYSTAGDLLKLVVALKAGRLSAPKTVEDIQRGIAIAGGAPGINAFLETHPKIGYTVIALSNYDPPAAMKAGQRIGALLKRLKD